jgi:hypothetical protein
VASPHSNTTSHTLQEIDVWKEKDEELSALQSLHHAPHLRAGRARDRLIPLMLAPQGPVLWEER